ncbi:hypothetical protein NEHOM01_1796 [Nematocida homosporus]|uniref:uncharacterized protein n=1 Tax=Nematocida homosporus TaxID=1912981 RepID=UPI00221EEF67|nr:uncharacterized protein NEHOM01_1796 [Nematocida homosporus]KAI5186912.1 hypothetical protein NEHOM01_1796 [Nematocida homosporus]
MNIREIWPEVPIDKERKGGLVDKGKKGLPRIPKEIEQFGFKIEVGLDDVIKNRSLLVVSKEIIGVFNRCIWDSLDIRKRRDIQVDLKKISKLYEEANQVIAGYRLAEAKEKIALSLAQQIEKKKELLKKMTLQEL